MNSGIIKKEDVGKLLHAARETYTVYAPLPHGDEVSFDRFDTDVEPALDYLALKTSAKKVFFPQCEVLCAYRGDQITEIPEDDAALLLFGIRPCDARAIALLDKLFGEFGGRTDTYYIEKRADAVIISRACAAPEDGCFCTSVGGDPSDTEGSDVMAYDVGDSLLLEAITEDGSAFLKTFDQFMAKPSEADYAEKDRRIAAAQQSLTKMDLTGLKEKLAAGFDSDVWDRIAEVCLGCAACTYQCPTCHCFDITDDRDGDAGRRIRTWDSCQFSLFTCHASGHNPRDAKHQRMRQRILHKFLYTVENVGETFCVGCGRCIRNCPVNLDLREALKRCLASDVEGKEE